MKRYFKTMYVTVACVSSVMSNAHAAEEKWFLRPNLGVSALSDQTPNTSGVQGIEGQSTVSTESGFVSGIGVGYRINDTWGVELAWEYRSNDSRVSLPNGQTSSDGDFASNIFFLNSLYHFDTNSAWQTYVGGGISWVQEVDIDLAAAQGELSYSAEGDIGFQLFAGLGYEFNENWQVQAEVRYGKVENIDLAAEPGSLGVFSDIAYEATTLQLGLVYSF